MNKHPHAEVIKAWVDGIPCQYREDDSYSWRDLSPSDETWLPVFYKEKQYRIKPELKRIRGWETIHGSFYFTSYHSNTSKLEASPNFKRWVTDWIEVEV